MTAKHHGDKGGGYLLGGMFKGLTELVEKLGELAEKGEALSSSGALQSGEDAEKGFKGVYGFSVKIGLGKDKEVQVEPFGNIRQDKTTGETVVQEMREPLVDLFDEQDELLIVAEMPGVSEKNINLELEEDILTLSAKQGEKRYKKEILLPQAFRAEDLSYSCNNGVLEIHCAKGGRSEE